MPPMRPRELPPEINAHYGLGFEQGRLSQGSGRLEAARTRELLQRYLAAPPVVVIDLGGGPGAHACWLAALGYHVHLIDPVPLHVQQAREASARQPEHPLASASEGDARHVDHPAGSAAAVLMLGPLYHLTARPDRVAALREASRVAAPGGVVLAAVISRWASLLDGLTRDMLDDPGFARIVAQDLIDGQHRNPTDRPDWFTTAYFHAPEEIASEVQDAGLVLEALLGIEGPGWLLADLERRWESPSGRDQVMRAARELESALAMSPHWMAVARRPRDSR